MSHLVVVTIAMGEQKNGHGRWIHGEYLQIIPTTKEETIRMFINKEITEEQYRILTKEGVE